MRPYKHFSLFRATTKVRPYHSSFTIHNSSLLLKYHRPLLQAVADILEQTFTTSQYAEKILDNTFKLNGQFGKRDRAFVAETVFECVRWWRYYAALLGFDTDRTRIKTDLVKRIMGVHLTLKEIAELENPFFENIPKLTELHERQKNLSFSQRASYPEWLNAYAAESMGVERWHNEANALNNIAPIVIRCNTLKTNVEDLQILLAAENITTHRTELYANALVIEGRANLLILPAFKEGLFEIQDAGSQCIAPFLKLKPNATFIDACAGAGGKTLHAASLMNNKGRIIALDIHQHKLNELHKRAARQGVKNIESRLIDSEKVIRALKNSADAVLLDVPCSGLGVLRRQPDTKWKLTPQALEDLIKTQAHILKSYSHMTCVGGCVVYATCSILPAENEQQVEKFLSENAHFELEEQRTISPHYNGFDGFFMARLRRK